MRFAKSRLRSSDWATWRALCRIYRVANAGTTIRVRAAVRTTGALRCAARLSVGLKSVNQSAFLSSPLAIVCCCGYRGIAEGDALRQSWNVQEGCGRCDVVAKNRADDAECIPVAAPAREGRPRRLAPDARHIAIIVLRRLRRRY